MGSTSCKIKWTNLAGLGGTALGSNESFLSRSPSSRPENPVFSENDILKIPHMQNGSDTEKCCFHAAINKQVQLLVMRIQTQGQNLLRRPSEELGGGRNILQPTQMIIP